MVFPYPEIILGPTECMSGGYTEFTHKELLLITLCYYSVVWLQLFKMSTVLVVACDDGIARCAKSTLSQQSLMELFIFGIHQAGKISGSRECPEEVCNWEGVTCNADGEVEMFFSVVQMGVWHRHTRPRVSPVQYEESQDDRKRPQ